MTAHRQALVLAHVETGLEREVLFLPLDHLGRGRGELGRGRPGLWPSILQEELLSEGGERIAGHDCPAHAERGPDRGAMAALDVAVHHVVVDE